MAAVTTPFSSYYGIHHALRLATTGVSTVTSSAIDCSLTDADYVTLIVSAEIAGGATVDCKLQCSETSGGSYDDITDGAITTISASGSETVCVKVPAGHGFIKTVTDVKVAQAPVDVLVLSHKKVLT